MPESDNSTDVFSETISQSRAFLLQTLQNQLDNSLADHLTPENEGVPFINIDEASPPIAAIQKVINALYYAEEGMKLWEGMDTSTTWGKAKSVQQGVYALTQIYKSLALLNDASPEIQAIVAENYGVLEPVFSSAYAVIKESGWLNEFMEMETTDKASTVINQGIDLLGPDLNTWNTTNPLIATFSKISQLMNSMSDVQKKELTTTEKRELKDGMLSVLEELDNNPFFHKLTLGTLEESKAAHDLLNWFKTIKENDLEFTQDSMENYVAWSNHYLPVLILMADQLERQNYLKPGTLSRELCASVDKLGKEINKQLSSSNYGFKGQVITTDSLAALREQRIAERQIKQVQAIQTAGHNINTTEKFYTILAQYQGKSFTEILETDRVQLRQMYPELQAALAHQNLDLENKLTAVLNEVGPEGPILADNSWWGSVVGVAHYVTGLIVSGDIDSALATKESVTQFFEKQRSTEHLKLKVSETSREQFIPTIAQEEQLSLDERVLLRVNELKTKLPVQRPEKHITPGELVPVKAASLNNFKGNIAYLQQLQLSKTIHNTHESLTTLVSRHLAEEDLVYFSTPPYTINQKDPEYVVQIKQIENCLFNLEKALHNLEQLETAGIIGQARAFISIAAAGYALKKNMNSLSPAALKVLAPIVGQARAYAQGLSDINYRSGELSDLEQLNHLRTDLPIKADGTNLFSEEVKQELKQSEAEEKQPETPKTDYAKIIASARTQLLDRLKTTLSAPMVSTLIPAEQGVPFIDLDNAPPQVAAVKKLINSMYYAEAAIKSVQSMDNVSDSTIDKIALMHRRAVALSQIYKSLESFSNASLEVQSLIHDNYDLIEPAINYANSLIKSYGLATEIGLLNVTKTVGSLGGRGVNLVQSGESGVSQSVTLVGFLSELPAFFNSISASFNENHARDPKELQISEGKIDSIGGMAELFLENINSIENYTKTPHAFIGVIELIAKMKKEGNRVQESTLSAYQQWFKKSYPELLCMIDELEVRNYLKPGTLSAPIIKEIDQINRKLNESLVSQQKSRSGTEKIVLATDIKSVRESKLREIKGEHLLAIFQVLDQEQAAARFFSILRPYEGQSIANMTAEDRILLKNSFMEIQDVLTNINVDVSNDLVSALNYLDHPDATKGSTSRMDHPLMISKLLKQESLVTHYLTQQNQSHLFKIKIVDEALIHLRPELLGTLAADKRIEQDKEQYATLQNQYQIAKANRALVPSGDLKPVAISSLNTIRGNMVLIQEMELSSVIRALRQREEDLVKNRISPHIISYLRKPEGQPLHVIKEDDPTIPAQIKHVENGLYHLESALVRFEKMTKEDSLVTQIRSLIVIAAEAEELKQSVESLSPEVKKHYEPFIKQLLEVSKLLQSVEYNKADADELKSVLENAKGRLLKLKHPQDLPDASRRHGEPRPAEEMEHISVTGARGLRLGVKYAHLASPPLEQARNYLRNRYPHIYGEQATEIRSFSRDELASDAFMRAEIERLNKALDDGSFLNTNKSRVIIDLTKQLLRVGAQAGELADMVNQLVTEDYVQIKENAYRDLIIPLSQEEDYLCLKPGTLLDSAMLAMNQLFISAALELEMPFKKKLDLFDEAYFIDMLIKQTEQDLKLLLNEQESNPTDKDLPLKILIKQDKLIVLRQQKELFKAQDVDEIKSTLLDAQFEVYLRVVLKSSYLNQPLIKQYENEMRKTYKANKEQLLVAKDSGVSLLALLQNTEEKKIEHYLLVDKAYNKLEKFSIGLPLKNQDLKEYIKGITTELINEELPIEKRSELVKGLPRNKEFIDKICSADEGTGFLKRFTQFIERFTKSVAKSVRTGANIIDVYYQLKIEQKMENIEASQEYKERLNSIRNDAENNPSENIAPSA